MPEPLTDPLRLLPPGATAGWWILGAALALVAWWWWRQLPRKAAPPAAAPQSEFERPSPRASSWGKRIRAIGALHRTRKSYREGCHYLASELRAFLEQKSGRRANALSVEELDRTFDDPRLLSLMWRLRDLRFAPAEPDERTFSALCVEAERVVDQPGGPRLRAGGGAR